MPGYGYLPILFSFVFVIVTVFITMVFGDIVKVCLCLPATALARSAGIPPAPRNSRISDGNQKPVYVKIEIA